LRNFSGKKNKRAVIGIDTPTSRHLPPAGLPPRGTAGASGRGTAVPAGLDRRWEIVPGNRHRCSSRRPDQSGARLKKAAAAAGVSSAVPSQRARSLNHDNAAARCGSLCRCLYRGNVCR
jgi:hypothetical protein